ncbi:MAG: hypothetical protein PHO10_02415 [Gemmiger sp.]|nr:hypothetical protein [Gemmiger sp.]
MKKYSVMALLAAVLLAGCQAGPAAGTAAPTPAPTVATTPTAAPTAAPIATATPVPTATPGLPYDALRPVAVHGIRPATIATGYFTVSQGGKWGLIRADGTELLPCRADRPVAECGNHHWVWPVAGMDWAELDQYTATLEGAGENGVCPGHGGAYGYFFYDLDWPGRDIYALDGNALCACRGMDGPGTIAQVTEQDWDTYGDLLPVFSAHEVENNGTVEPGKPEDGYWYISRNGSGMGPEAQNANWFFDQPLAPVEQNGKWRYIDRNGGAATEAVYDATYSVKDSYGENASTAPDLAAYLQNGYAAVCRDGGWGLLNGEGTETLPAHYAGAAWEGTTLWLKEADGWHQSALPSEQLSTPAQPDPQARYTQHPATAALWRDGAACGEISQNCTVELRYGGGTGPGNWQPEDLAGVALYTGVEEETLRALNPGARDGGEMQGLLLQQSYTLPQIAVRAVTIRYQEDGAPCTRSYPVPDALDAQAGVALAEALDFSAHYEGALGYRPAKQLAESSTKGEAALYQALPGARFSQFSKLRAYLNQVFGGSITEELTHGEWDGKWQQAGFLRGPEDALEFGQFGQFGYGARRADPTYLGMLYTEPEIRPQGDIWLKILSIHQNAGAAAGGQAGTPSYIAYMSRVQLCWTGDGYRVAQLGAPG